MRAFESFENWIEKEKCETFTNWKSKKGYEQINFSEEHFRSGSFILDLWYQQYCNVIVELTNIKFELFSKHFSQRTQQHGDCTKPLSNDKFV